MGACVSSNQCAGRRDTRYSIEQQPQVEQNSNGPNDASISSIDGNISNNNNITNLHQIHTNSEPGSLNNLASIINNSISFHSNNSNSVLIANTITNTSASYYNGNSINSFSNYVPPTGKNKRLKKDFIKNFKFDKKISENQLNSKREEFWDTAPAFEGKIEIWTALKAAVEAYEQKNYQLSQAIIDSANIILPRGFLNDCYDELGNRYQIPIYVLAKPVNMKRSNTNGSDDKESTCIDEDSETLKNNKKSPKKSKKKSKFNDSDLEDDEDLDDEDDDFNIENLSIQKTRSSFFRNKLSFTKVKNANNLIGSTSFSFENKNKSKSKESDPNLKRSSSIEEMFQIKTRVSNLNYNENDLKLKVTSNQSVAQLKSQLSEMLTDVEPSQMRMFFGGKLMKDKQKLKDHKLRRNVVVQVIIRDLKVVKIRSLANEKIQDESENINNDGSNINSNTDLIVQTTELKSDPESFPIDSKEN